MPLYEARFIAPEGRVIEAVSFYAEDDAVAFDTATDWADGHPVEVWEGTKFIATAEARSHDPSRGPILSSLKDRNRSPAR